MGYHISWLAFAPDQENVPPFRLVDTGKPATPGVTPFAGARLSNGWYVLAMAGFGHELARGDMPRFASWESRVVACHADENVMASVAAYYQDGNDIWQVTHMLDAGREHLDIEGKPPASIKKHFPAACDRARREGFDAVFDVPLILAEEICGFRHDRDSGARFTEFVEKEIVPAQKTLATLLPRFVAALASRGFARTEVYDSGVVFVAERPSDRVRCSLSVEQSDGGGARVSINTTIENLVAQGVLAEVFPDEPRRHTYRADFGRTYDLHHDAFHPEDVHAWAQALDQNFGGWIDRQRDPRELDKLVNDGSPRYNFLGGLTRGHYDMETGHTPLVIAWLGHSPAFEGMVKEFIRSFESDGEQVPPSFHQLVERIRRLPRAS